MIARRSCLPGVPGEEKEIREICAELDKFSKRSAVDLDTAAQKVRSESDERLQSTNYYIETDQSVTLNNSVLPPGIGKRGRIRADDYPRDLTEFPVRFAVATVAGAFPPVTVASEFSASPSWEE
jgi:hypothetical protein